MSSQSIYPFLPQTAGAPPQNFPYDVVINEAFPGIQFIPTEPNGEYQEIREVSGSLWLVTNAMWNANLLQWDQESNQNPGLPAYAFKLNSNGSMTRYESPPTNIPMTPITWVQLWQVDSVGEVFSSPLEVTSAGTNPADSITISWDPGIGVAPIVRQIDVTDIASSANSLLDNMIVNSTQVWAVDKTGTLVAGRVPASAVINLFNNPTFTGTSTFNGPVIMNSTLDVFGATTTHGSLTADTTLFVAGLSTLNGHANVNGGETVTGGLTTDTIHVTGASTLTGHVNANGGETVAGGLSTDTIDVSSTAVFHGIVETGSGGPVVTLTSNDNSVGLFLTGQNYALTAKTYATEGSLNAPNPGANTIVFSPTFGVTLPGSGNTYIINTIFTFLFSVNATVTVSNDVSTPAGNVYQWVDTVGQQTVFNFTANNAMTISVSGSAQGGNIPAFKIVTSDPVAVISGSFTHITYGTTITVSN